MDTPESGVCTDNDDFGARIMQLNEIGQLAKKFWIEIPNHFPFIKLGEFVVMPNHMHGILIINHQINDVQTPTTVQTPNLGVSTTHPVQTPNLGVSTPHPVQTPNLGVSTNTTIGVIINQYKRMVTIHARKIQPEFAWLSRFHDHIIRNAQSLDRIQNYIINNPLKWQQDCYYQ